MFQQKRIAVETASSEKPFSHSNCLTPQTKTKKQRPLKNHFWPVGIPSKKKPNKRWASLHNAFSDAFCDRIIRYCFRCKSFDIEALYKRA